MNLSSLALRGAAAGLAATALAGGPARAEEEGVELRGGRAAGELGLALLAGTAWYFRNLDFNSQDWDLDWDWPSWRRKLTFDAVRFDSNQFPTNAEGHTRAGIVYYQIARGNGLGALGAVGATFGVTAVWESLAEYREQVSINDFVVNTGGGWAVGEPMFQLGLYLRRGANTPVHRGLAAALAPAVAINDRLARRTRPAEATDRFGLPLAGWHRFDLGIGVGGPAAGGAAHPAMAAALDTELITVRRYGRGSGGGRWVGPGSWSALGTSVWYDGKRVPAGSFATRALIGGYHRQSIDDGAGAPRGWSLLLGLGSAFEWDHQAWPGSERDFLARVGILGPHVEAVRFQGAWRLRWEARGTVDFGMVPALGLDAAAARATARGTVRDHGYYHGFAGHGTTRLEVERAGVHLHGEASWTRFESIEGKDRSQEQIVDDFHMSDGRLRLRGGLTLRPWDGPMRVGLSLERLERTGAARGRAAGFSVTTATFTLGVRL